MAVEDANNKGLERICIIGSGNWGSAISTIIGRNVLANPKLFHPKVTMWAREELVDGRLIDDWINVDHINPRYLPGISIPENIYAERDLVKAVKDATLLVFVIPHQFVRSTCKVIQGKISPNAKAISLIKGVDAHADGLNLISTVISSLLDDIPVSVLMGANIANEVAQQQFCESTVGSYNPEHGELFRKVFDAPYFRVNVIKDAQGVELCGALKNIVAIGAGLVDGVGLGDNTKAAVIRIGLIEMKNFSSLFHNLSTVTSKQHQLELVAEHSKWETYFESCGIADLITTCFGGRNRRLAEMHAKTGKSFATLEEELLDGQKLQGPSTAKEVYDILHKVGKTREFPLFTTVYRVCYENLPASQFIQHLSSWSNCHHSDKLIGNGKLDNHI